MGKNIDLSRYYVGTIKVLEINGKNGRYCGEIDRMTKLPHGRGIFTALRWDDWCHFAYFKDG